MAEVLRGFSRVLKNGFFGVILSEAKNLGLAESATYEILRRPPWRAPQNDITLANFFSNLLGPEVRPRVNVARPEEDLPRILDVGCGPNKFPGAIGVDKNPRTAADVLCHFDEGGLPFADNSFDQVRAVHVIEHVADVVKTMEEFHRITRPGGTIYLVTPHYTDYSSFRDPTHRWHLNSFSFIYFYPQGFHGEQHWYTQARLRQRRVTVKLLKLWKWLGIEFLVNRLGWFRRFWEFYLSFVIRGKVMEFEFEVVKSE